MGRVRWVAEDEAVDGLVDDPDGGGEHEAGFDEGGEGFDLAVAVVVVFVGGAAGDLDGEEGDRRGDKIDGGVCGLGQHAERTGEQAGDELERGNDGGGRGQTKARRCAWRPGQCAAGWGAVVAMGGWYRNRVRQGEAGYGR